MIIHSKKDSCVYNQLESNKSYYNLPINITQSYMLPVLCAGYVTEITLYTYSSGQVALAFHKIQRDGTITSLSSVFGRVDTNGSNTVTVAQSKPFYIYEDLMITVYTMKSLISILREHKVKNPGENHVVGRPGMYVTDGVIVTDSYDTTPYNYQSVPSLQMKVESELTTEDSEDTTVLETSTTELFTTEELYIFTSTLTETTDINDYYDLFTEENDTPSGSRIHTEDSFLCFASLIYLAVAGP